MNAHLKERIQDLIFDIVCDMAEEYGILDDDRPDWMDEHMEEAKERLVQYLKEMGHL